jgi:hypothetical protein
MGSFRPDRRVFRRGDKVLGYWVDHAEGFEVRFGAGRRARVDAIVIDPRRGRAKALVVRSTRLHRRRLIPVEAVVAVDPFARRLEVERAHRRSLSRRLTRLAAAAWVWLVPRVQTVAGACRTVSFGVALRFGRALATGARSTAAWLGPRLSAGTANAWTHAATAVPQLGTRLSNLARRASIQAVGVGGLCVLGIVAATAWIAPRLRASAETVVLAALACGVAAAEAVYLVGRQLSRHVHYASTLRRN